MILAKEIKRIVADPVENIALQVPRAIIASAIALVVDFFVLEFFLRVLGTPVLVAAVIGYFAGCLVQYVLCSLWVFSTSLKEGSSFTIFLILSSVGLALTWIVMVVAHQWSGVPVEFAKAGAVALAFTWNFMSRKYLLFRS